MLRTTEDIPRPLTPGQVARLFNVSITTVGKWADAGLIPSFRTPGGQRRFYVDDVDAAIDAGRIAPKAAS
jgi:excisionase family DNA binding protein